MNTSSTQWWAAINEDLVDASPADLASPRGAIPSMALTFDDDAGATSDILARGATKLSNASLMVQIETTKQEIENSFDSLSLLDSLLQDGCSMFVKSDLGVKMLGGLEKWNQRHVLIRNDVVCVWEKKAHMDAGRRPMQMVEITAFMKIGDIKRHNDMHYTCIFKLDHKDPEKYIMDNAVTAAGGHGSDHIEPKFNVSHFDTIPLFQSLSFLYLVV
jgi:hypothetical protein